jgi:cyclopropane fatty-acyl-phospholipid synthase-like methyltransferase
VGTPKKITLEQQLEKMRQDWDARARENARHYVDTSRTDWTDETFFASGEQQVAEDILTDMGNICQGKDPRQMRVLEIGCGAGRLTRAFSNVFGEVHAVDISGEMVAAARKALAGRPGAHVYQNNGCDLRVVPKLPFDFVYSAIVFQHIPSREVIENYVREVRRLLRPGALFKFWVQGDTRTESSPEDTWLGVPFSDQDVVDMAERCGFEPRHRHGAGGQYFILWFFKYTWSEALRARMRVALRTMKKRFGRLKASLIAKFRSTSRP